MLGEVQDLRSHVLCSQAWPVPASASTVAWNRSSGFAYQPIIGSGRNSCVLHYVANNKECKNKIFYLWILEQNIVIMLLT